MSLILQRLIEEYFCTIPVITAGGGQFANRPRSAGIPAAWILKQEKNGLRDRLNIRACDPDIPGRFR